MKRLVVLALCLGTLFPNCSPAFCASGAKNGSAARSEITWTPQGYLLTESALRDTAEGWTAAKKQAEIRLQALETLREEIRLQQKEHKRRLAQLQAEISSERKVWRARVRKGAGRGLLLGLAADAAVGYIAQVNSREKKLKAGETFPTPWASFVIST